MPDLPLYIQGLTLTRSELVDKLNELPDLPVVFPVKDDAGNYSLYFVDTAEVSRLAVPVPSAGTGTGAEQVIIIR